MFGFLKKKLKDAVDKFTGSVKEEVQEQEVQEVQEEDISEAEQEILEKDLPKEETEAEKEIEQVEVEAKEESDPEQEELEPEEELTQVLEEAVEKVEEESDKIDSDEDKELIEAFHDEQPIEEEPKEEPLVHEIEDVVEEIEDEIENEELKDVKKEEPLVHEVKDVVEKVEELVDVQEKEEIIEKAKEEIKHDLEDIKESETIKELEETTTPEEVKEVLEKEAIEEKEIEKEIELLDEPKKAKPKKKSFLGKIFGKKETKEEKALEEELLSDKKEIAEEKQIIKKESVIEEPKIKEHIKEKIQKPVIEKVQEPKEEIKPKRKSFFEKVSDTFTKKTLSESKFDELFWELELTLLESNVAVEVIEKIKENLKVELTSGKVSRVGIDTIILQTLKSTIKEILSTEVPDMIKVIKAKENKPYVICFVGINGSGKTTNLAKFAHLCKANGLTVVAAACDTFRAAAIQQLENHTDKIGIKLIKQDYGADAAAVAFDAIKHAEAKGADVVLIDTAGRLHSNTNLMDELKKIIRVAKPDYKIFVGEATTGNDCVEQASQFNDAVEIDGSILSKADVDDKGGAAISLSYVTGKPILYLGVGQEYKDLEKFDSKKILKVIGLQ